MSGKNEKNVNVSIQIIRVKSENTVAIFSNGSFVGNSGSTGVGTVILKNDLNKFAMKQAKEVSNSSTNNHGEVVSALMFLHSNVHIFSDTTAAINAPFLKFELNQNQPGTN